MPKESMKDKLEHAYEEVKQGLKDLGERAGDLGIGADPSAQNASTSNYRLPQPENEERSSSSGRRISSGSTRSSDSMTKDQLYAEAKRLGVKGRSQMSKDQLARAVKQR